MIFMNDRDSVYVNTILRFVDVVFITFGLHDLSRTPDRLAT